MAGSKGPRFLPAQPVARLVLRQRRCQRRAPWHRWVALPPGESRHDGAAGAGDLLFAGGESNGKSIGRLTRGFKKRLGKYGNVNAEEAAAAAGPHEITATQKGTAWVMQLVAFRTGREHAAANTAYPLKVGPTGRYLVDQQGVPFLITGDSPQALMVNLSEAEADSYFADRQAAGFNAVWINLLCATYTGGRPDGSTYDGIVPSRRPAIFDAERGLLRPGRRHARTSRRSTASTVFLDPAETGSWLSVLQSNGVTKSRAYGQYLGSAVPQLRQHRLDERQRFPDLANPSDDASCRRSRSASRTSTPAHPHGRARLSRQRLARRSHVGADHPAQRVVHATTRRTRRC